MNILYFCFSIKIFFTLLAKLIPKCIGGVPLKWKCVLNFIFQLVIINVEKCICLTCKVERQRSSKWPSHFSVGKELGSKHAGFLIWDPGTFRQGLHNHRVKYHPLTTDLYMLTLLYPATCLKPFNSSNGLPGSS